MSVFFTFVSFLFPALFYFLLLLRPHARTSKTRHVCSPRVLRTFRRRPLAAPRPLVQKIQKRGIRTKNTHLRLLVKPYAAHLAPKRRKA